MNRISETYSVGIYARLSVDSDGRKNESIGNQLEMAKAFLGQQPDMVLYDCYTDLGKTGMDFCREGFERLMEDVRTSKVNCIIVKDLSRFGRDHVETGNYLEKIFPFLGVRFIALADGVDSMGRMGRGETLGINLKNLVNELYARDISRKVKSSRRAKWEQGSFTGGAPPYGYRVGRTADKTYLVREEAASDVVRQIYGLFLSGKNRREIVAWLYGRGIVRPNVYRRTGKIFCGAGEGLLQWPEGTVKLILTNPAYMGCLARKNPDEKGEKLAPTVKKHTHEAIVSEEMFFAAAARFEKTARHGRGKENGAQASRGKIPRKKISGKKDSFGEVLYCGSCKSKMKPRGGCGYGCPGSKRIDKEKCGIKGITLSQLAELTKEALRQAFVLSGLSLGRLKEESGRQAAAVREEGERELRLLEKKRDRLNRLTGEAYARYRMGEAGEEDFLREKEANRVKSASLLNRQEEILRKLNLVEEKIRRMGDFFKGLTEGEAEAWLTEETINALIHRIEVFEDGRVRVVFAFAGFGSGNEGRK